MDGKDTGSLTQRISGLRPSDAWDSNHTRKADTYSTSDHSIQAHMGS